MKTNLIFKIAILIIFINQTVCFKIDFENGENHLHFESNAIVNDKIINEPKVPETIKKLSGIRFPSQQNEMSKKKYRNSDFYQKAYTPKQMTKPIYNDLKQFKQNKKTYNNEPKPYYNQQNNKNGLQKNVPPVKIEYNEFDIPRIFITNINKNANSNDLSFAYEEEEGESNYEVNKEGPYRNPSYMKTLSKKKIDSKNNNQTNSTITSVSTVQTTTILSTKLATN